MRETAKAAELAAVSTNLAILANQTPADLAPRLGCQAGPAEFRHACVALNFTQDFSHSFLPLCFTISQGTGLLVRR